MRNERLVALRRRLIPYGLLGPGIIWLILFFVVPLYFMGRLSLESGIFPEFHFDWNFSNYSDALAGLRHAVRADVRVLRERRRSSPC